MNVVFPCCANWETFIAETKSETFFVSRTQHLCPQQMLRARANGETFVPATMCPRLPVPLSEADDFTKNSSGVQVILEIKIIQNILVYLSSTIIA